jgi:hypothetical protein
MKSSEPIGRRSFIGGSLGGGAGLLAGTRAAALTGEEAAVPTPTRGRDPALVATAATAADFIDRRWVEHTYFLTRAVSQGERFSSDPIIADTGLAPVSLAKRGDAEPLDDDGREGEGGSRRVAAADPGWGTDPASAMGSVHPIREGLGMWYIAPQRVEDAAGRLVGYDKLVRYAVSTDGRRFTRPNLGLVEFRGSRENNIVLGLNERDGQGRPLNGPRGCSGFCVLDAERQPVPHARGRYTALYGANASGRDGGLYLAWSDDGMRWNAYPENPLTPSSDTYCNVLFDPGRASYAIYMRPSSRPDGVRAGPQGVRSLVSRIESDDLIHWSGERVVFDTDEADAPAQGTVMADRAGNPEIHVRGRDLVCYGMTVTPHQGGFIGMAQIYDVRSGGMWCELVHSHDGVDWRREPRREPFIPLGPPGAWDSGMVGFVAAGGPAEVGDDWYFYYTGNNWTHHFNLVALPERGRLTQIGGIRVKRGRLVGYRTGGRADETAEATPIRRVPVAWANKGELLTRPFRLDAAAIHLNANAGRGSVVAEVCDVDGATLAGFTQEHAVPLRQDGTRQPLSYRSESSLADLRGRVIRLRLHLDTAAVFGLSFA